MLPCMCTSVAKDSAFTTVLFHQGLSQIRRLLKHFLDETGNRSRCAIGTIGGVRLVVKMHLKIGKPLAGSLTISD